MKEKLVSGTRANIGTIPDSNKSIICPLATGAPFTPTRPDSTEAWFIDGSKKPKFNLMLNPSTGGSQYKVNSAPDISVS